MKTAIVYLPGIRHGIRQNIYRLPKLQLEFSVIKYLRMFGLAFALTGLVVTWGFLMWGYIFR